MSRQSHGKTAAISALLILLVGLTFWAIATDLDYGVHADGRVVNRNANIPIQHNTLARVVNVRVQEGMRVRAGDVLLVLDDHEAVAEVGHIESQRLIQALQINALRAELTGTGVFAQPRMNSTIIPRDVLVRAHTEALQALTQRLSAHHSQLAQFKADVSSAQIQLKAVDDRLGRLTEQSAIVEREILAVAPIVEDRLLPRSLLDEKRYRLAELQRGRVELHAERSKLEAMIEQTLNKQKSYLADREKEIRSKISELEPQVESTTATSVAANLRLSAKTIRAAADGQIINLKIKSPGEVIQAGAVLMELVQEKRQYFVEARVHVAEIENIQAHMPAEIHFVTLPSKSTPYIDGSLVSIASNSTLDEKTGYEYYIAVVDFGGDVVAKIGAEPSLGMPVEVLLKGGRRSVVSYIVEPFRALLRKSMKES